MCQCPKTMALQFADRASLDGGDGFNTCSLHIKDETIGKFAFPGVAHQGSHVISITLFELLDLLNAPPPRGPSIRIEDEIPHLLLRSFNFPDCDEFV